MRNWKPNQKLTDQQIQTIKHLKDNGVQLSLIARVINRQYGVSLSTAYYHASDNRDAYSLHVKKVRAAQRERIKAKIHQLIQQGCNTEEIAETWNMELATINKIYAK